MMAKRTRTPRYCSRIAELDTPHPSILHAYRSRRHRQSPERKSEPGLLKETRSPRPSERCRQGRHQPGHRSPHLRDRKRDLDLQKGCQIRQAKPCRKRADSSDASLMSRTRNDDMNTLTSTNNTQRSRRPPLEHASDVARSDQSALTGHINSVIGLPCCQTRTLQRMHRLKDEPAPAGPDRRRDERFPRTPGFRGPWAPVPPCTSRRVRGGTDSPGSADRHRTWNVARSSLRWCASEAIRSLPVFSPDQPFRNPRASTHGVPKDH
jgi:hypothetical protein